MLELLLANPAFVSLVSFAAAAVALAGNHCHRRYERDFRLGKRAYRSWPSKAGVPR